MDILFGFGKQKLSLRFPDRQPPVVLQPQPAACRLTGPDEVRRSLREPIGAPRLSSLAKPGQRVVVITSDITRPAPSAVILPPILEELAAAGVRDEDILVVFALGSHRGHTEEEKRRLVGDEVYRRVRCVDHNPADCVSLGTTSRGTPVELFRPVAEADLRVCVGNIEYHYFAGYSGGAKAILPGVSTRSAIQANHSRMVQPEACAGRLDGNPVREDIDEVARFCPADYIVNVVLDENKRIVHCVSGHFLQAHREGCALLDRMYKAPIAARADVVVVSPGGYPKDINLYQAQKALDNARHAVRDGGTILWLASCAEGLGERTFEQWMTGHARSADMIERIRTDFQLGGHKAAAIAMVLQRARIVLVSDLDPGFVRSIHLEPASDAQAALDAALAAYGPAASVIAMPYGGSTLPCLGR